MSLRGRVALVSGASRGIGRAIAESLAAEGMSLILLARTGSDLRELAGQLADEYDTPSVPAAVDVTDAEAVRRVLAGATQQLGEVDLLVNNAGVIERAEVPFWESDLADVWRVVETNLRGPLVLTRAVLPEMIARGRGHVVTVVSRARAATLSGTYTGYAISKRGLSIFTESLAGPLAGTGVVAVDVLPGLVRTALTDSMPTWRDVTDWDDPRATARLVVAIARGEHDGEAGTVLEATTR